MLSYLHHHKVLMSGVSAAGVARAVGVQRCHLPLP